jgi:hypothetical protein
MEKQNKNVENSQSENLQKKASEDKKDINQEIEARYKEINSKIDELVKQ